MNKLILAVACALTSLARADVSLSGVWRVEGEGFSGEAKLPGTLAAAHLGKRWTERDFQTTMDLAQSEALVQEWQYVGKATWARMVELSAADCEHPMELFLERVMWASEAYWDGKRIGECDSLATPHVYRVPQSQLTPGRHETIKVALKYDPVNKVNAIKKLVRVSSPGLRKYTGYKEMPRVINGLGIAILSTSKGVMTDKEAAELKIGGEVLCYVY